MQLEALWQHTTSENTKNSVRLFSIASVVLGKSKIRDEFIGSLPKEAQRVARQISREIDTSTEELVKSMQMRAEKLLRELTEQACIELVEKNLTVIEHHRDELPEEIYEIFKTAVIVAAKREYTATVQSNERVD